MSGELIATTAALAIAAYIALALVVRARSIRARGPSVRQGSGPAVWLPYFLPVPYVVLALRPGPELDVPGSLRWAGLALVVAGVALACWAALTLGRHFDLEVEVHHGHEVVRDGPFAVVRHPVYAGLALHLIGACLASGNLLMIAGTLFAAFPAFDARARAEEALLRTELGEAYDRYAREVPMLVPLTGTARR